MKYFLDTNVCIYALKRNPPEFAQRLGSLKPSDIGISVITAAELRFGASNSQHPVINQRIIDTFLSPFTVDHFSEDAAFEYGHICAYLRKKGTPIGPLDALIAAHALSKNVILVSNNLKEFSRVPKLKLENWLEKD